MNRKTNLDLKHGSRSQKLGAKGEARAAFYLFLHGYKILERNYTSGRREVDIIAKKGSTLAFIEVKSAVCEAEIPLESRVTFQKQKNIIAAAKMYVAKKGIHKKVIRFDIITVDLSAWLPWRGVRHIINAFSE